MFERSILVALATAFVLLPAPAKAELFQRMKRDHRRNSCWPAPFLAPDRMAVRAPFAVMINNGWRTQNTLSDEHFDTETGMLNEAGKLKVRDILSYSPPEHRTVFVLQAHDEEMTAARNRSVNQFAARINTFSEGPMVAGTNIRPRGWPAENVSSIGTRFNASMPDPRLPAPTTGGGAGGGGGGGSGGGGGGY